MSLVCVINSGSSSIKYQLIDLATGAAVVSGLLERIGEEGSPVPNHEFGMSIVLAKLGDRSAEISAVGHRVVHGGPNFDGPALVTAEVEAEINDLSALAPLHNPANLLGIRAAKIALPTVPHVAVFDTAFHQTLPADSYTYAIDTELAAQYRVRRYGFHGTSHEYVSRAAAEFLGRPLETLKTIVLHLGNGASVAAIDGGRSIDTSMGLTPLEGLVMGTRSGDIDAGVIFHLARQAGLSIDELDVLLNRRSGLLGLTGSGDMRDVQEAASRGNTAAQAALAVWRHRIRHYIGAYIAELGGLDALVFTAGIGENNSLLRRRALAGLEFLGIEIDDDRNELASRAARFISPEGATVSVLVIPTNEELEIARQTAALVGV
ncbi:acetate/propionate family kinase [Salinibacterium hongtaonis]|uniref:Acetate kinase n=1 Tax=Homoserinimonas hongtaonis TaxID=2079791 RepID=A0A2U1T0H2_9MICO|nr:acetate kinase [Salinibacterium hongtaonis]AWB89896.1 acetate kinase [Salinibacterium hongtaonis]PWB97359.1 acetate kinase [Salinibacterium hongtaonis]